MALVSDFLVVIHDLSLISLQTSTIQGKNEQNGQSPTWHNMMRVDLFI